MGGSLDDVYSLSSSEKDSRTGKKNSIKSKLIEGTISEKGRRANPCKTCGFHGHLSAEAADVFADAKQGGAKHKGGACHDVFVDRREE